MKIYSIKEIVQATNNLYNRANGNKVKSNSFKSTKKGNEILVLSDPIEEASLKENLKVEKKIKPIKRKEIFNKKTQSNEEKKENEKKDEIVNELFSILKSSTK